MSLVLAQILPKGVFQSTKIDARSFPLKKTKELHFFPAEHVSLRYIMVTDQVKYDFYHIAHFGG